MDTSPYAQGYTTYTWTYNMPAPLQSAITTGKTFSYLVVPWAYDLAQNREFGPNTGDPASGDIPGGVGRVILFDNEKPVAVTTAPANNAYLNGAVTLYGTATDNISGTPGVIDRVLVQVKARGADISYWKGTYTDSASDWDAGPDRYTHWSTAAYAGGAWSIALPSLTPRNNSKISVWARAVDQAGNWMDSPDQTQFDGNLSTFNTAAYYFTFDNTMPLTTVTVPDAATVAVSTGLFSGQAIEAGSEPSGVTWVKVRLRRSDNAYWRFGVDDWTGVSADWPDVTNLISSDWTRNVDITAMQDGYQYYLNQFAYDNAGNNSLGAYFSTFTFIVDMTTPTSRITFPVDGSFIGSVPYIEGTADDRYAGASPRDFEAGISTTATDAVQVAIRKRAGCGAQECWWNGAAWQDSASVLWSSAVFTGASSGTWKYNLPAGTIANGTTYYALSRVRDIVSNIQTVYATNYFTGDTTPPMSQAASPSGTVESVNTISGTAQDTLPGELKTSGVVKISIKQTTEGGFAANKCYDSATSGFIACPGGGYPNNRLWLSTGTTADPSGQPAAWTWDT
ncbi:MAG: hypothetical protein AABZ63_01170, partial [Actinomycetota bacterium]